jgi:hypothetical protein
VGIVSSKDLVPRGESTEAPAPGFVLAPLMYAHLLLTRDTSQHREWRERLEHIEQANELAETTDPRERALLARPEVWRDIRRMTWIANAITAVVCASATASLVSDYALGFGFGYLAAGTYWLPLPIAWMAGRRMYQNGMLWVMKNLGANPDSGQHIKSWARAMFAAGCAGFAFAFVLTFLQGLISWFMTPAPTLMLELYMDVTNAFTAALMPAGISAVFWPLICRKAPTTQIELSDSPSAPALPAR